MKEIKLKNLIIALTGLIFFLRVNNLFGQQEAQFTNFMVNPYLFNPALSGSENYFDVKAGYRNQWNGIAGAPRTFYVGAHGPVSKQHTRHLRGDKGGRRSSVGGLLASDKAGDVSTNIGYLSYSYTMTVSKGTFFGINNHKRGIELALGAFVGAKQYKIDLENAIDYTQAIDVVGTQTLLPDASLGAWLYIGDYTYAGLSVQQLLGNSLTDESKLFQHYNFVMGAELLVNRSLKFLPSLLFKQVKGAPLSFDLNCRADIEEKYFAGISYRRKDALSFLLGTLIDEKYEIAYSYDYVLSNIRTSTNGGHEIILGMRLKRRLSTRNPDDKW